MTTPDPLVGTRLGPCQLEALIGRGGMGRVYKARHIALDRLVAVKLVDEGGAAAQAARAQVLEEARAAAKLEDPRVVAVYEVGEDRGLPYIVMQWVEGESLEARVKRSGPLAPQDAVAVVRETALALKAAHAAGLVHRDVKPGNILIDRKGGVKLTDFGIARAAGKADGDAAITGSFHFMAPEQALGGPPDPRSDLYALAATWYYALTGKPPFPGTALDALARHREEAPPDPRQLTPEVTERAAILLLKTMSKKPEERPQTAEELAAGLSAYGILLDTDTSGSPFRILPAKPREEKPVSPPPPVSFATAGTAPVPAAAAPSPAAAPRTAPPPAPPPPAAEPVVGSRAGFLAILAALGALAFGWQWRRAGASDWAAAAAVLAALPAALTVGDRRQLWRKAVAAASVAGALTAWWKAAMPAGFAPPLLEAAILAGLGVCALGGGAFLGLWGEDRSEASWCRALSPAAGALLLASALLWGAPEAQGAAAALSERGAAWWSAFAGSGGPWRWGGTLAVGAAMGAASRLRGPKGDGRVLNWNR